MKNLTRKYKIYFTAILTFSWSKLRYYHLKSFYLLYTRTCRDWIHSCLSLHSLPMSLMWEGTFLIHFSFSESFASISVSFTIVLSVIDCSILIRSTEWDKIKANLPWLLDAVVCVGLDLFVSSSYSFSFYLTFESLCIHIPHPHKKIFWTNIHWRWDILCY